MQRDAGEAQEFNSSSIWAVLAGWFCERGDLAFLQMACGLP
jgi:hypothetical protein